MVYNAVGVIVAPSIIAWIVRIFLNQRVGWNNMPKLKGTPDIAPMIRGAFVRAAKRLERKGKSLSEIIEASLEDRPLETLKVIGGFVPKEMLIEKTITMQLDEMSEAGIDAEIRRLATIAGIITTPAGTEEKTRH